MNCFQIFLRLIFLLYGSFTVHSTAPSYYIVTLAGTGTVGAGASGSAGTSTALNSPTSVIDLLGSVYFTDRDNDIVRRITNGILFTVAGTLSTSGNTGDGGPATSSRLNSPEGICSDTNSNLFIVDRDNDRIRVVNTNNIINAYAGTGSSGSLDGPLTSATFNAPRGCELDNAKNSILVADTNSNKVRLINLSTGTVSTLLGTGAASSVNGALSSATINSPFSAIQDSSGNYYFADTTGNSVRMLAAVYLDA